MRFDGDEAVVECGADLPSALRGKTEARLLVDGKGALVGVDLGEEPDRLVVMLGRHEDVDRVVDTKAEVRGASVHIANAKRWLKSAG